MMNLFYHSFHLVTFSPWPLFGSLSLIILMLGMINWFNLYGILMMINGKILLLLIMYQWWRDIIRESTFQGNHTLKVLTGLRIGMLMFILSEVMFFFSFFWTYFHMFLSPSIEIGSFWPPIDLLVFDPFNIPLLNTLILLSSGVSITWCHYSILKKNYMNSKISILLTLFFGFLFILFQFMEYSESYYTMSDSVYGSIFFLITGFQGLHVIIGSLFIFISMVRLIKLHYSLIHHFGFESASWYWHFVDVGGLFLYLFIYWLSY
uniref:Cytochrome c oxidase subunit 3 n=1 Tax=Pambolus sp. QL-2013 TaxID=1421597 RepID=A0A0A6ZLX1_9HYME|nr:cytochrome c oxidase subunit III [Pambolus sp. QL-2013]